MLEAVFYGFLTGVVLCFTFGTVFFSLVQNSIDNGYKSGIKIAAGVLICDALFVICAIFGTALLPSIEGFEKWLAGIGCIFLVALGISNLVKGQPKLAYPKTRFGDYLYYISTGFLLNGLNPVNFISWVTITSYLRTNLSYDFPRVVAFLSVSIVAVFITESLIAVFSHKLKKFFTPRVVDYLNKITGIVFIGIALRIAYLNFYV